MNSLHDAIVWLNDPLNWTNPGGLFDRLREHLEISFWAVLIGCAILAGLVIVGALCKESKRQERPPLDSMFQPPFKGEDEALKRAASVWERMPEQSEDEMKTAVVQAILFRND